MFLHIEVDEIVDQVVQTNTPVCELVSKDGHRVLFFVGCGVGSMRGSSVIMYYDIIQHGGAVWTSLASASKNESRDGYGVAMHRIRYVDSPVDCYGDINVVVLVAAHRRKPRLCVNCVCYVRRSHLHQIRA